jgi:hypothetical protein
MEYRKLKDIKLLDRNPRTIRDDDFKKLVQSIEANPDYFEARPLILSDRTGELVIIAGNQRYRAAKELKLKEVPTFLIKDLTEEREKEIIIRDNVSNGQWDFDLLANEWDVDQLEDWGLDIPNFERDENQDDKYTQKIDTPVYEPKNEKPKITELYNAERYKELISEIDNSSIDNDVKAMLKVSASRHIVFNYENMADYYAHSSKDVQILMENSALVIIDFDKAIELNYVKLKNEISEQCELDEDE